MDGIDVLKILKFETLGKNMQGQPLHGRGLSPRLVQRFLF